MAKKRWSDLSPLQQKLVIAGGIVEAALTAYANRDLSQRTADEVRGPKLMWRAATFVQPVGPLAYLVVGRRTPA